MKSFFKGLLPKKLDDKYLYILSAIIFLPLVYISFGEIFTYMAISFSALFLIVFYFIIKVVIMVMKKEKFHMIKSKAVFILLFMHVWMFVGTFFAQNKGAAWLGMYNDYHQEVSIWQHVFLLTVSLLAVCVDKQNIKFVLYEFITLALIIMTIQFIKQDYGYGLIHRNNSGYYFCTTAALCTGLLVFSRSIAEKVFLSFSLLMHFTSLILNSSCGPLLGLIAFFIIGSIYYLIHNRKNFYKFLCVVLSFVAVCSIIDFIPKINKLKVEGTPVITQMTDISLVALNKFGIISDSKFDSIMDNKGGMTPGANGYARMDMWERSIDNMKEFPAFGVGAGSWWTYNPDMPVSCPHNEYMQYGSYFGAPVLFMYLLLILYVFVKFRKKHKQINELCCIILGAALTYLVQAIFGNVFSHSAPILYALIGFAIKFVDIESVNEIKKEETESQNSEDNEMKESENFQN